MSEPGVYTEYLNGAELHFELVGELDQKRPALVYLHGGPGYNSASFQGMVAEAWEEYGTQHWGSPWPTVYLDQRGCGRSAPLAETEQGDESLDLDTLVADLEALRQYLEVPQLIPLGHGFGALIALEYTRRHPERVRQVIVVNPWLHFPELAYTLLAEAAQLCGAVLHDPAEEARAAAPEGTYPQIGAVRVEAAFELVPAHDLLNTLHFRDARSRLQLEFLDTEAQLWAAGDVQDALVHQGLWEFEYPRFLPELTRPVYSLAGTEDPTAVPGQVAWLTDLVDAEFTALPGGHYPWLDDLEAFIKALGECLDRVQ